MKENPQKPFEPYITIDQMAAYQSGDATTHTESRLINAVCEAFEHLGYSPRMSVADYLGVAPKDLSAALRLIRGLGLKEARLALVRQKLATAKQLHPDWSTDHLARSLGFADSSALFRILGETSYNTELSKFRRNQGYTARRRH